MALNNAAEAEARRLSQSVPIAKKQIDGAGVWTDQASTGISTIPALRGLEAVKARVGADLPAHNITKLAKAIWGRLYSNPLAVHTLSGRAPSCFVASDPLHCPSGMPPSAIAHPTFPSHPHPMASAHPLAPTSRSQPSVRRPDRLRSTGSLDLQQWPTALPPHTSTHCQRRATSRPKGIRFVRHTSSGDLRHVQALKIWSVGGVLAAVLGHWPVLGQPCAANARFGASSGWRPAHARTDPPKTIGVLPRPSFFSGGPRERSISLAAIFFWPC